MLLTALVFGLDLATPPGFGHSVLYSLPVLLGLRGPGRAYVLGSAAAASVLTVAGVLLSGSSPLPPGVIWFNRSLSILFIWATAGLILLKKRSDRKLTELSLIVESSDDAILSTDQDGVIRSWNAGAERLYGWGAGEIVGRHASLLVPQDRPDEWRQILARVSEGRTPGQFETLRLRKDGTPVWVSLRISPVRDEDGRITGYATIARDITARRRAEERLDQVLKNAPVVLFSADRDGIITFCEGRPLGALNLLPERVVGRSVFEVLARYPWAVEQARRALGGARFTAGGEAEGHFWEAHYAPLLDAQGVVQGAIAVSIDVTDRRRAEERLVQQAALAQLGEMAAVVAHEVKNPLAGIGGAIQVLRERLPPESPDRPVLAEVLARLGGLHALVQDLLSFARPRPPRLTLLPILPTLRETAELLGQDPALSGIEVRLPADCDATVRGDRELLKEVFFNLLLNGAQAQGGRGALDVSFSREGDRWRISFSDSGPGIPPEIRPKVFEPFFTTKHRGTGLGLAVARRLVEAHGGELRLEFPEGGGTTAVVMLPAVVVP